MLRAVAESVALFLGPFAVYALYLLLRARYPLEFEHWSRGRLSYLTLLGLAAALTGFLILDWTAPRGRGAYVPPHLEKGVLVPGHID